MSATASITDVLPVRSATTSASSEPGAAPAVDFGAIVAQLQGAAQPAAASGATTDPAQAASGDAASAPGLAASGVALPSSAALPSSGATLPASATLAGPGVPSVASLEPGSLVSAAPDESHVLTGYGIGDEGDGPGVAERGQRGRQAESVPGSDDRASDEAADAVANADAVAATAVPSAMPGFVMPLVIPAPAPDRTSSAAGTSSERDLAIGTGSAASALASSPFTAGSRSAGTQAGSASVAGQLAGSQSAAQPQSADSQASSTGSLSDASQSSGAASAPGATTAADLAGSKTAGGPAPDAAAPTGGPVNDVAGDAATRIIAGRAAGNDSDSGDATARNAATARAATPARDASTVIQSEVGSLRTLSPTPDQMLTASRDLMPAVRRVRIDASRDINARDAVAPVSERGGDEPAMPGATSVMPFDTSMSAARAMAADEPGRADEVRAPVFEQVAARLRELRTDGRHEITMRLDPADLGGVTIDARLEGTRLTVHIRAEHGATQELLNDTLPRLRESLAQQGFVPEQLSVQLGFDGSGASGGGAAHDRARSFNAPTLPGLQAAAPARTPRVSATTTVSGTRGGLDLWA